jgi:hypothetical protein
MPNGVYSPTTASLNRLLSARDRGGLASQLIAASVALIGSGHRVAVHDVTSDAHPHQSGNHDLPQ